MSDDNSHGFCPDIKMVEVASPIENCCRGSGQSLPPNTNSTWAPTTHCDTSPSLMESSDSFEPRPFPPPSLLDVPVEYIIDQLHNLAPHYWDKLETADCTLVVPVPYPGGKHASEPLASPSPSYDPSGLGRRATEPTLAAVPLIRMQLHTDYLSAHSSFLRSLFSGASPIDLINPTSSLHPPGLRTSSGKFTIPPNRLPRLMPSSTPSHPVLYLPIPDPASLHYVVHWMYFGTTDVIEDALVHGVIQWEGIARNVEYLGLPTDIKVFLGRWFERWLNPDRHGINDAYVSDEEGESDTACSDDDDYDDDDDDLMDDLDSDGIRWKDGRDDDEEPCRGRTRATRCLSWASTASTSAVSYESV
ncbi:hypothetical protein ARMSODRAFT_947692 [Armillaria solidipes]|uniref:BTB domain-containing protein n=1 Tax=Armillaria solidipes TaxID=1076256 RepID=A0A2H3CA15_9AGAR|nr:hypothetical protein ARMSODRAFT_947692 [Armillaria solidipes]